MQPVYSMNHCTSLRCCMSLDESRTAVSPHVDLWHSHSSRCSLVLSFCRMVILSHSRSVTAPLALSASGQFAVNLQSIYNMWLIPKLQRESPIHRQPILNSQSPILVSPNFIVNRQFTVNSQLNVNPQFVHNPQFFVNPQFIVNPFSILILNSSSFLNSLSFLKSSSNLCSLDSFPAPSGQLAW